MRAGLKAVVASELLDRVAELDRLSSLLDDVAAGGGRLLVVEGQPGIGKTALLRAAHLEATDRGMAVLSARGGPLEQDFAFGLIRQLFERTVANAQRELLTGAAGLAAPLFSADVPAGPAHDRSQSIIHGLYWLVVNLTQRAPLVVSVDDVHWADPASLRSLAYLVRRLEGLPILVAVALRSTEHGAAHTVLHPLLAEATTTFLRPSSLGPAAVSQLVRARLSRDADEAFCRACAEATAGNPFLLDALCEELAAAGSVGSEDDATRVQQLGPKKVASAVLVRLSRLPRAAARIARAVAVLGEGAEFALTRRLAEVDEPSASEVVSALIRAGILEDAEPLRFIHPIVRTTVYQDLTRAEQVTAHRAAARLLAELNCHPDHMAAHVLQTTPAGESDTVERLQHAARHALARGAPEVAVRYLRRALAEPATGPARAQILAEIGDTEARLQDPMAMDHLCQALEEEQDATRRARSGRLLGRLLAFSGRGPDAVAVLERAATEAAGADPELALAIETDLIDAARFDTRTAHLAIERAPQLRARLSDTSTIPRSHAERLALVSLALVSLALDAGTRGLPATTCVELCSRALSDGELLAEETADSQRIAIAAFILMDAERLNLADQLVDGAFQEARHRGSQCGFAHALILRSWGSYLRGALADAGAEAMSALDTTASPNDALTGLPVLAPQMAVLALSVLLGTSTEAGDLDAAELVVRHPILTEEVQELFQFSYLLWRRGQLRMAQGKAKEALEDFLEAGRLQAAYRFRNLPVLPWRSGGAVAHAALGQHDEAQQLGEEEMAQARTFGVPWALGIALRSLAVARGGDEGLELLREAVTVLEPSMARLEHARALTDLGAALRRMHHPVDARLPLRDGLDLAERCGARLLAQRAAAELGAAGAKPRRRRLTGPTSLTACEHRIANMAMQGMTNPQIAQTLFVTPRTVEMHLTNAYRKLEITSRAQLSQALASEVLVSSPDCRQPDRSIQA